MKVGRLMFHEPMLTCVRLGAKAGLATAKNIYETTGLLHVKVQLATSNAIVMLSRAQRTHLRQLQCVSCWQHPCPSQRAPSCGRSQREAEGMSPAGMAVTRSYPLSMHKHHDGGMCLQSKERLVWWDSRLLFGRTPSTKWGGGYVISTGICCIKRQSHIDSGCK